jgi:hypothetical protein
VFSLLAAPERSAISASVSTSLASAISDRQHDVRRLARGGVVAADLRHVAFGAGQLAAALAALDRTAISIFTKLLWRTKSDWRTSGRSMPVRRHLQR